MPNYLGQANYNTNFLTGVRYTPQAITTDNSYIFTGAGQLMELTIVNITSATKLIVYLLDALAIPSGGSTISSGLLVVPITAAAGSTTVYTPAAPIVFKTGLTVVAAASAPAAAYVFTAASGFTVGYSALISS